MIGGFSSKAFGSGAFFTPYTVGPVPRLPLPVGWLAVSASDYVCDKAAAVLLLRGVAWSFDGGALRVGGAALVGSAGGVYRFGSAATAGRWVAESVGKLRADLVAYCGLSSADSAAWLGAVNAGLAAYAGRLVNNAAKQLHAGRRAALLAEAALCDGLWGAP